MRFVLVLVLVVGCGPKFVKLDAARAHKLDVALVGGGNAVCRRAPELRALVTYRDNKFAQTRSRIDPRGTLRPAELRWVSDVGAVDASAQLQLPALQAWHDRPLSITVSVPGRPDVADRIVLTPAFDCDGEASHDGLHGGGGGAYVEVALAYVDTTLNGRLVLARVIADGGAPEYHLIDRQGPAAARFVVSARGGAGHDGDSGSSGSSGSDGTRGSDGSSGGTCQNGSDGTDGSDGGDGGDGGDGSDGGDGGAGGSVVITYPEEFPELAGAIEVDVSGGAGGRGGWGGSGGSGGSGGKGGTGGSPGTTVRSDGTSCLTLSGSDGRAGRDGRAGSSGRSGADGSDGPSGSVMQRASRLDAMFGAAEGWPIVR
jgi:hypothetical protein